MTTTIREWKEVQSVELFDGTTIHTESSLALIKRAIENNKFIEVGGVLVNTSSIKRVFKERLDYFEQLIMEIEDVKVREKVRDNVENRKKADMRINEEIIKNIIERITKDLYGSDTNE